MICRFFLEVAALAVYFIVVVVTMPSGLSIFSFVFFLFFCWSHSQTPGLCSAKELLVSNLCYTTRARILSDYNIFCTLKGERATVGSNAYGTFLVLVSNSGCCRVNFWLFNPLNPKSDKHLLFPDSIAS